METKQNKTKMDDKDDRILCKDESCIGTIGSNGCCRVCGLPKGNQPVDSHFTPEEDVSVSLLAEDTDPDFEDDNIPDDDIEDSTRGDWEERTLCRDESCTGTIGSNGRCRVCGMAGDDLEQ